MRDSLSPNGTDDQFGMVWEGTDNDDESRGNPELTVFSGGPSADRVSSSDPEKYFRYFDTRPQFWTDCAGKSS